METKRAKLVGSLMYLAGGGMALASVLTDKAELFGLCAVFFGVGAVFFVLADKKSKPAQGGAQSHHRPISRRKRSRP